MMKAPASLFSFVSLFLTTLQIYIRKIYKYNLNLISHFIRQSINPYDLYNYYIFIFIVAKTGCVFEIIISVKYTHKYI